MANWKARLTIFFSGLIITISCATSEETKQSNTRQVVEISGIDLCLDKKDWHYYDNPRLLQAAQQRAQKAAKLDPHADASTLDFQFFLYKKSLESNSQPNAAIAVLTEDLSNTRTQKTVANIVEANKKTIQRTAASVEIHQEKVIKKASYDLGVLEATIERKAGAQSYVSRHIAYLVVDNNKSYAFNAEIPAGSDDAAKQQARSILNSLHKCSKT